MQRVQITHHNRGRMLCKFVETGKRLKYSVRVYSNVCEQCVLPIALDVRNCKVSTAKYANTFARRGRNSQSVLLTFSRLLFSNLKKK